MSHEKPYSAMLAEHFRLLGRRVFGLVVQRSDKVPILNGEDFFTLIDTEFMVHDRHRNDQPYNRLEEIELAVWADEMAMSMTPARKVQRCSPSTAIEGHAFDPVSLALDRLEYFMDVGDSHAWLLDSHDELSGQRPVELMASGQLDTLWAYIDALPPPN